MAALLRAENVGVRFRKGFRRRFIQAVDGLNLEVGEGDFLAMIGANGAGKSTAMYCFLGLVRPTSGRITLFGDPPRLGSRAYAKVGYLPEDPHYHLYLTVQEAVSYYAALSGGRPTAARISAVLERLGLAEFRDLRLSKCSKGMKQKVGIAQCLLHSPALLFLDEPMRGLDPIIVREFREILVDLHRGGTTVVMNSHLLSEVEALASRVAILDRGRVALEDTVANLTRGDADVYSVDFEGGAVPDYVTVQARFDGHIQGTLPAASFWDFMEHARTTGGRIVSCVRTRRSLEESFVSAIRGRSPDA
jgi:ABC-2 type transport system ATP-binding protein